MPRKYSSAEARMGGFTRSNRARLPEELPGMPMKLALEEQPSILALVSALFLDVDERLAEKEAPDGPGSS